MRPLALHARRCGRVAQRQLPNSNLCARQLSGTPARRETGGDGGNLETSGPSSSSAAVDAAVLGSGQAAPPSHSTRISSEEKKQQALIHYNSIAESTPRDYTREVFADANLRAYMMKKGLEATAENVRSAERALRRRGVAMVGDRRLRLAKLTTPDLPFEALPYECFQEALKVLRVDREEKVAKILETRKRIARLEAMAAGEGKEKAARQKRLKSLREYAAELEILADINDPEVKRKFENGEGDMNKPIYRMLSKQRWESMEKKVIEQRIGQFYIVPDVLPEFSPSIAVRLDFGRRKIPPGNILPAGDTTIPPNLHVQVFDDKPRLLTVLVMDTDVPLPTQDRFGKNLHFLAANIPWSGAAQTPPSIILKSLQAEGPDAKLAVPWLPPTSQKGAPYHRLSIFVLEQPDQQPLDVAALRARYGERKAFSLRSITEVYKVKPVGFTLFRTIWDPTTEAVMKEHGIPGWDVELKPQRWKTLKPPRKPRGWEAKRQGAKFKHLWKYTKRIKSGKGKGPR